MPSIHCGVAREERALTDSESDPCARRYFGLDLPALLRLEVSIQSTGWMTMQATCTTNPSSSTVPTIESEVIAEVNENLPTPHCQLPQADDKA